MILQNTDSRRQDVSPAGGCLAIFQDCLLFRSILFVDFVDEVLGLVIDRID